MLLWNVEGLKNVIAMSPENFLKDYDIAILTETFLTENLQHPNFYGTHLLARQGDKGRPSGGITILLKPHLRPIITIKQLENTLICETDYLVIIAAYFKPNMTAIDIMDELGQTYIQYKQDKPIIIAGDLNCRLDSPNYKTKLVLEKLEEEGFTLLNNPKIPTYISHNGKSAIDIALTKGAITGNITTVWNANHSALRKHIPLEINIQSKWEKTQDKVPQQLSRKIDIGKVEAKLEATTHIETLIENKRLEEATQMLGELLRQAANHRTERRAKPWFDNECYQLRRDTLDTLQHLRKNNENRDLLLTYADKRKHYKRIIKEKKSAFLEEEGRKLAEEAKKDPYVALRPKKQTQTHYIDMETWESHFNNILNKEGLTGLEGNRQEIPAQTLTNWTPLTTEEVGSTICNSKNKKAAGPDGIYNEYIKDTVHLLDQVWTNLYNKCIQTASIPEQWRKSIVKVLYKGKGDPKDPNKYRGIALENCPFKIFTKIITERIKEEIDEHLPESQFGFRKGKSTLNAIELLLKHIWEALEDRDKFYTVFIDFTKAFDLLNRKLVIEKLKETLGSNNIWTNLINTMLSWNEIYITDNIAMSEPIIQTNGVLQGDPLSPLLFILATEEILRITQQDGIFSCAYADDIVIGSRDITKLQKTINEVEKWCSKNKLDINITKTDTMIFRNGGRAPIKEEIYIRETKLKIVPDFKYLGITLQTSAKCFTKHITEKTTQAILAIHEIRNIRQLSLETAMLLFRVKIQPILTYGIEIIWSYLTMKNLSSLERVKARYLKAILGVSKTTQSRLAYLLTRETFLIDDLRTSILLPSTSASQKMLALLNRKREEIHPDFYSTGAMVDRAWTKENFEMRHVITRLAVHGFHHLICKNTKFHDPNTDCRCMLCDKKCDRYHIELCTKRSKTICEYAKM